MYKAFVAAASVPVARSLIFGQSSMLDRKNFASPLTCIKFGRFNESHTILKNIRWAIEPVGICDAGAKIKTDFYFWVFMGIFKGMIYFDARVGVVRKIFKSSGYVRFPPRGGEWRGLANYPGTRLTPSNIPAKPLPPLHSSPHPPQGGNFSCKTILPNRHGDNTNKGVNSAISFSKHPDN